MVKLTIPTLYSTQVLYLFFCHIKIHSSSEINNPSRTFSTDDFCNNQARNLETAVTERIKNLRISATQVEGNEQLLEVVSCLLNEMSKNSSNIEKSIVESLLAEYRLQLSNSGLACESKKYAKDGLKTLLNAILINDPPSSADFYGVLVLAANLISKIPALSEKIISEHFGAISAMLQLKISKIQRITYSNLKLASQTCYIIETLAYYFGQCLLRKYLNKEKILLLLIKFENFLKVLDKVSYQDSTICLEDNGCNLILKDALELLSSLEYKYDFVKLFECLNIFDCGLFRGPAEENAAVDVHKSLQNCFLAFINLKYYTPPNYKAVSSIFVCFNAVIKNRINASTNPGSYYGNLIFTEKIHNIVAKFVGVVQREYKNCICKDEMLLLITNILRHDIEFIKKQKINRDLSLDIIQSVINCTHRSEIDTTNIEYITSCIVDLIRYGLFFNRPVPIPDRKFEDILPPKLIFLYLKGISCLLNYRAATYLDKRAEKHSPTYVTHKICNLVDYSGLYVHSSNKNASSLMDLSKELFIVCKRTFNSDVKMPDCLDHKWELEKFLKSFVLKTLYSHIRIFSWNMNVNSITLDLLFWAMNGFMIEDLRCYTRYDVETNALKLKSYIVGLVYFSVNYSEQNLYSKLASSIHFLLDFSIRSNGSDYKLQAAVRAVEYNIKDSLFILNMLAESGCRSDIRLIVLCDILIMTMGCSEEMSSLIISMTVLIKRLAVYKNSDFSQLESACKTALLGIQRIEDSPAIFSPKLEEVFAKLIGDVLLYFKNNPLHNARTHLKPDHTIDICCICRSPKAFVEIKVFNCNCKSSIIHLVCSNNVKSETGK